MSYPIFLNLKEKDVLVIGGGKVATRRVHSLIQEGAKLTIISPHVTEELEKTIESNSIDHIKRGFQHGDIQKQNFFLIFSATNDNEVNRQVFFEANHLGIPVNTADEKDLCTFIMPSVVDRHPLKIAISTDGQVPLMSRRFRERFEREYGEEYSHLVNLCGIIRKKMLKESVKNDTYYKFVDAMMEKSVIAIFKDKDNQKLNDLLLGLLGSDYSLKTLNLKF